MSKYKVAALHDVGVLRGQVGLRAEAAGVPEVRPGFTTAKVEEIQHTAILCHKELAWSSKDQTGRYICLLAQNLLV